jgi:hypothetical protein
MARIAATPCLPVAALAFDLADARDPLRTLRAPSRGKAINVAREHVRYVQDGVYYPWLLI